MGYHMEGFPSGQREQTVNLLATLSVVRIHPLPPTRQPVSGQAVVFLCFVDYPLAIYALIRQKRRAYFKTGVGGNAHTPLRIKR